jgi:hypothetical protein
MANEEHLKMVQRPMRDWNAWREENPAISDSPASNREHLYRRLSSKNQPRLNKLLAIVSVLGFRVRLSSRRVWFIRLIHKYRLNRITQIGNTILNTHSLH